jgi:quercetin dioxygenase-like cupin family protein
MDIMKTIFFALAITLILAGCSNHRHEATVEQKSAPAFPKGEKITNDNFAGTAYLHMMGATDTSLHVSFGNVTFEPGARTNWHSHPGGQVLFITEGRGYYQAKGQLALALKKGDFVEIPRNVVHWHGAAPDSEFAHIAVSLNTDEGGAVWIGPVTDEEYQQSVE